MSYKSKLIMAIASWQYSLVPEKYMADKVIYNVLESVIDIINDQEEVVWIPCSEQMPEDDAAVLITVNGRYNNIIFENAILLGSYYKGDKPEWEINGFENWTDPQVIAWMELPEPYKEEKDGK